jgi:hypothetical protein
MLLLEVLAGVELGVWDRSFIQRLVEWDSGAVLTFCSLVYRAQLAERVSMGDRGAVILSPRDISILEMSAEVLSRYGRRGLANGLMHIARGPGPP